MVSEAEKYVKKRLEEVRKAIENAGGADKTGLLYAVRHELEEVEKRF